MAEDKNDIPPIPVPPVESAPKKRVTKPKLETAEVAPIAPLVDLTKSGATSAPRPDPYATAAPANPYVQPSVSAQPAQPHPGYAAQPGYAQAGQPYAYQPYPVAPPQGLSIASLILGIGGIVFSFVWFGFWPGLAAVITGHLAQRRQPYAKGFWITGLVLGYISVGIGLISFFVVVAFFAALISGGRSYGFSG